VPAPGISMLDGQCFTRKPHLAGGGHKLAFILADRA
jgi:hypothetical protein